MTLYQHFQNIIFENLHVTDLNKHLIKTEI